MVQKKAMQHDRRYWHYYHLLRDQDFIKMCQDLNKELVIQLDNGKWCSPTDVNNFGIEYIKSTRSKKYSHLNPRGRAMNELIWQAMELWAITGIYDLLNYLIKGKMPPMHQDSVDITYDEALRVFIAYIPLNLEQTGMDKFWKKLQTERKRHIATTKETPQALTEESTAIAYAIWKLRTNKKSWQQIVKTIDAEYGTNYSNNTKAAQDLLKTQGYFI